MGTYKDRINVKGGCLGGFRIGTFFVKNLSAIPGYTGTL